MHSYCLTDNIYKDEQIFLNKTYTAIKYLIVIMIDCAEIETIVVSYIKTTT